MRQEGLTLLELLISLSIAALLISIAVPGYSELRQRDQTHTATLSFYQTIQLARNYAVTHNMRVTMTNSGHWHSGWDVYADANNNGQRDDAEPILWSNDGLGDVKVEANKLVTRYVSFIGSGEGRLHSHSSKGAFQAGTFKICHPKQQGVGYQLTLSKGGRINMQKLAENPCKKK